MNSIVEKQLALVAGGRTQRVYLLMVLSCCVDVTSVFECDDVTQLRSCLSSLSVIALQVNEPVHVHNKCVHKVTEYYTYERIVRNILKFGLVGLNIPGSVIFRPLILIQFIRYVFEFLHFYMYVVYYMYKLQCSVIPSWCT